jgi:aminoglycoside/choline kinase family phosphotransferase
MSGACDYMRGVLFAPAAGAVGSHPWTGILAAMNSVTAERTDETETLLRKLLTDFDRRLLLDPSAGASHAMPPEDLLRAIAIQALGSWDLARHRDVILPHADPKRNDILGTIARKVLSA